MREAEAAVRDTELPADVFARTPDEAKADAGTHLRRPARTTSSRSKTGKKKAQELSERFAPWYYLVPGDAFREIVLDRESLTQARTSATSEPGALPSGFPPGLNFPGEALPSRASSTLTSLTDRSSIA